ncbi:MAG: hypothetical protein ACP5U0_09425 [Caldisphaera sp.]
MIKKLITYLPFNRMREIETYFRKNIDNLKTENNIVYVDNVFNPAQLEILKNNYDYVEIRGGNWNDRNLCFLQIIEDSINNPEDILVVDSDNVLNPNFQEIDETLTNKGYAFYNVADLSWETGKIDKRSKKIDSIIVNNHRIDVYTYKIYGIWREIFFIGPKQAVRLSPDLLKRINRQALLDLKKALNKIDIRLRNYISDETSIGFVYYYSGIKYIPWIAGTEHIYHSSSPLTDKDTFRMLRAITLAKLGKELFGHGYNRIYWFYFRYKLAYIARSVSIMLKP